MTFASIALTHAAVASPDAVTVDGVTDSMQAPTMPPVRVTPVAITSIDGGAGAPSRVFDQDVSVGILAGGPLAVSPRATLVTLHRAAGNHFRGSLPTLTVVDPRGSLAGWIVSMRFDGGPSAMTVRPSVRSGPRPVEVDAGAHATVSVGGTVPIASAPPDGGGGTYELTAELDLVAPRGGDDTLGVAVSFAVS